MTMKTPRLESAGTCKEGGTVKVTTREKMVVLAVRGVLMRDKRRLLQIAKIQGLNTLSALLRRAIKDIIKTNRKAA